MLSFIVLCVVLMLGNLLRMKIRLLRSLYLPSCVVAGLLALVIIQSVHYAAGRFDSVDSLSLFDQSFCGWVAPWSKLPVFLINIVFACLFLGVKIPGIKTLWKRSGPQLAYGQIVAWGQYFVAIGVWIIALKWFFKDLPSMFPAILPVGFEGGHGTAAGMADTFDELGWAAGKDFALTSATFGILSAIVVGMTLINWAERKGYTSQKAGSDESEIIPEGKRPEAGKLTVNSDVIETLSLHIAVVGLACLIGWLIKFGLGEIGDSVENEKWQMIFHAIPLFPLCMLGGIIVQLIDDKFNTHHLIDLGMIRRIQNCALDFLVVAAIATIQLKVIMSGIVPLVILVVVGIIWNVFCVMWLARRLLPDAWFERAIAEMGQSMGVTATGLLLLRVVDPEYETDAADAFACKQLLHEPIMGGGLWTAMAIPLIATAGLGFVFAITTGAIVFWLVTALVMKRK
jgi:ESS family glutamate:Na+ symporter